MMRISRIISKFLAGCLLSGGLIFQSNAAIIGISIPLSGDFAELGREFRTGAKLAMEKYGQDHGMFIADDGCNIDLAQLAVSDLKSQGPAIITGFLCNEVAILAANQFREMQTPLLIAGARSVRLIKDREREDWNLWRMSPGDDFGFKAAAIEIEKLWRDKPFAVVDDGTIFGRTYTDGLRLNLNEAELPPQISDNFRAAQSTQAGLLRRLQRAGVSSAFIAAATTEDLVTIAKNKNELDVDLNLIMSDQITTLPFLEAATEIPAGLMVITPQKSKNAELEGLDALLAERNIMPTRQIYAGYAAIQVAVKAIANTTDMTTENLKKNSFETVNGSVQFDDKGQNTTNPYKLHVWDGEAFVLPDKGVTPTQ